MKVYHSSSQDGLEAYTCPNGVCNYYGHTADHVCFFEAPVEGMGEWVHIVDIPFEEIRQYQYKDAFRDRLGYAIPLSLLDRYPVTLSMFPLVTGREWSLTRAILRDEDGDLPNLQGLVWMSRPGIAGASVSENRAGYLEIDITLADEFDPEKDYVVLERHWLRERVGLDPLPTWELDMLAGIPPQWVIFPWAWRMWVTNERIHRSAAGYIVRHVPSVRGDVDKALHQTTLAGRARAWRYVHEYVAASLSREVGANIDLGPLSGHTPTAVASMPVRTASRMGNWTPERWDPPIPKPEFEDADASGRVLLANAYGIFPNRGPGVDFSPKDREEMTLQLTG